MAPPVTLKKPSVYGSLLSGDAALKHAMLGAVESAADGSLGHADVQALVRAGGTEIPGGEGVVPRTDVSETLPYGFLPLGSDSSPGAVQFATDGDREQVSGLPALAVQNTDFDLLRIPKVAFKFSTENVTSSTSLQDDNDLHFDVVTSGFYRVAGGLFLAATTGGIKLTLGGTATYTLLSVAASIWSGYASGTPSVAVSGFIAAADSPVQTTSSVDYAELGGMMHINAGGTLVFRWAQRTSSGTASSVLAGSSIALTRIA